MNSGTGTCTNASEGTLGSLANVRFIHHIVGRSTQPLQITSTTLLIILPVRRAMQNWIASTGFGPLAVFNMTMSGTEQCGV